MRTAVISPAPSRRAVSFQFPTDEFRSLPFPKGTAVDDPARAKDSEGRAKIATCFVRVEDLPEELGQWMRVNPRVPQFDAKDRLKGPVARAMVDTLLGEPAKFALKNQGIYLLVKAADFQKAEGGRGFVTITMDNSEVHGLANGGHTYMAIRTALADRRAAAEDRGEDPDTLGPSGAYVRLHIMEGVPEELITDLAEGLNRSMQVDNPSLANLGKKFDKIKAHLHGKAGADQIAYRQGDPGDVDILQVLTFMALFDLDTYADRKTHPNKLFGQPKAVLDLFVSDANGVFDRVLPQLRKVLVLSDEIQKRAVVPLGRMKVSNAKKNNRVRSARHRGRPAYFAGGTIDGMMHLGWLYPMLAAFRAAADRDAWAAGRLEWLVDPMELLDDVIEEMADVVRQENEDNRGKPGEVGRKEAAYRMCYSIVSMELAKRGTAVA